MEWKRFCDELPPEGEGNQGDWVLMGYFPDVGKIWCERMGDRLLIGHNIMPLEELEEYCGRDCWWLLIPDVPAPLADPGETKQEA